jgi:hypothetical protein
MSSYLPYNTELIQRLLIFSIMGLFVFPEVFFSSFSTYDYAVWSFFIAFGLFFFTFWLGLRDVPFLYLLLISSIIFSVNILAYYLDYPVLLFGLNSYKFFFIGSLLFLLYLFNQKNGIIYLGNIYPFFIVILLLIYLSRLDTELVMRPHNVIIPTIMISITGVLLKRSQVLLLVFFSLLLAVVFYESRVAIAVTLVYLFLLYFRSSWSRVFFLIVLVFALLFALTYDLDSRSLEHGIVSVGRSYIWGCFFENIDKLSFITPSYKELSMCSGSFGYSHSSYIEFLLNFGIVPFVIAIFGFAHFTFTSKNPQIYASAISFALFSFFEGGLEPVLLFSLFYSVRVLILSLSRSNVRR